MIFLSLGEMSTLWEEGLLDKSCDIFILILISPHLKRLKCVITSLETMLI